MGAEVSFPRGTGLGCEADHSPPSSAKVKNSRDIPPPSNMPSQCAQGLYLFLPYYSVNNLHHTLSKCGVTVNTQLTSMWKEAVII